MEEEKNKLKIISPEEALENFINWFDKNKKFAFILTLLAGIITHITIITGTIMSQDGLWNSIQYFKPGVWKTTLGRWGIALVERLNNFIAIPSISTVTSIFIMAITSVILVDLFEFKSKISIVFTSLILVVTPTLTVTLLYVYTSVAYCFNFLVSVLVIWFLYKFKYKKIGFVLSSICFMFSLSIYQSYIGISIGLCVMISILDLLRNCKTIKQVFYDILKTIGAVFCGGILYYILTMIILNVLNLQLAEYKANEVSILGIIIGLKNTILQAYKDFIIFFFGDSIVHNSNFRRELIYVLFFIMFTISIIIGIVSIKEENKKIKIGKAILILVFIVVLPICLNIIDIIIVQNNMYALTAVQMTLIIPFAFAIFELIKDVSIIKWIASISCIVIMGTYYLADNTSYAAVQLTYNQAYSTTMRIMDRIENTPGYKAEYPILFGGIIGDYNYPRSSSLYRYTVGSIVTNPVFHISYSGATGTWVNFIKIFYGLDIIPCDEHVYYRIVTSEEYKQMKKFPDESSVKIINGVVVVKLTESPELPF